MPAALSLVQRKKVGIATCNTSQSGALLEAARATIEDSILIMTK
jgi:hypothetical protein